MRTTAAATTLGPDDATLDRTRAAFQPYATGPLSQGDAAEIHRNVHAVLRTLLDIRRDRDARRAAAVGAVQQPEVPDV